MDQSGIFAHHHAASFESSADKVDYGFDYHLGHDASLTHGLDALGTCNNTENACLDQRCFDHYGKASSTPNTALDLGIDINSDAPSSPRQRASYGHSHPHHQKASARSTCVAGTANMNPDPKSVRGAHRQRQKRKRQAAPVSQPHDLHQSHHVHQMRSPQVFHHAHSQSIEPMTALQAFAQTPQLNFHHTDFHAPPTHFQQPLNSPDCVDCFNPTWVTNMMDPAANCMSMQWPPYGGAASAACSSACDDVNCWTRCEEGVDDQCCYDDCCAQLDMSHAACCFEPTCASLEPCLDSSCQEASIPCTDANCMGTPASVSVTTPSAEPEPIVNALVSPVEPGREITPDAFDQSAIGHFAQGFSNDLNSAHGFTNDLSPTISQSLDHQLTQNHASQGANEASGFAMPAFPSASKSKPVDEQPTTDNAEHLCRWLCLDGIACGQKFASNKELQDHCKSDHVKNLKKGPNGFCCTWWGCARPGPFSQKSKLERHMQTHTGFKPVKCDICGIYLSAKQSLEQHMRTHSGEKPWKCEYPGCTQSFKQQSALTMHMRTHTGEKPLVCEVCGKRFGESSNLSKHRRTHNIRGNHVCKICQKDFHRLDQLRRHMQTHAPDGGRKGSKSS
ncbi:hypothetical protein LRP88_08193 [Fusarium phalaenopsidis]